MDDSWFRETLHASWQQTFRMGEILFREQTELQDLVIFENESFGRVMALDGVIQLTQRDEFIYHEMIAHVPLFGHGAAKEALIIGGGDGGTLRECLRHQALDRVTMVEIDGAVVEMSKKYLPTLSDGAFDDPRTNLVIADGIAFVKETTDRFDVIIVDSTDPMGPAEGLFTADFYADCKRCLTPGGILVVQAGVPFVQPEELTKVQRNLANSFDTATFYAITVPTYVGGHMCLGWASDDGARRLPPVEDLSRRVREAALTFRYYAPDVHLGAFALPAFIRSQAGVPATPDMDGAAS